MDGSKRLCSVLYADMALLYLMVLTAWTNVYFLWHVVRKNARRESGRC